ncbi:hypothetical protein MGYG_06959 [Nannizzia gypsea CBS 118893]|uniref:Uncharacterized protein n=1 Tax=Arthroderma gypseum (strain ATCC MYA-4604 / CBS 118893) TaxID=535722 RepID=E4V1P4_ARTGP|nr:hypothetical protein MGYG_06959 [Nannizzia gypsea CBS 118893]EFR03959.1 hypothetical protein MGYG_06959 [Nannizzia gypsea CBS 118893]
MVELARPQVPTTASSPPASIVLCSLGRLGACNYWMFTPYGSTPQADASRQLYLKTANRYKKIPLRYSNFSSSEAGFAAKLEREPQTQDGPWKILVFRARLVGRLICAQFRITASGKKMDEECQRSLEEPRGHASQRKKRGYAAAEVDDIDVSPADWCGRHNTKTLTGRFVNRPVVAV